MAGGHVWWGDMHGGGMHGRGTCMAGACVVGGHDWQILRDTVNEQAVRILLECILVKDINARAPWTEFCNV